jgi:hypothetical protein
MAVAACLVRQVEPQSCLWALLGVHDTEEGLQEVVRHEGHPEDWVKRYPADGPPGVTLGGNLPLGGDPPSEGKPPTAYIRGPRLQP